MRYKIGELAKLLNISTNTVRRYEDKGYIQSVRDENSGYRYYNDDGIFGINNAKLLRKYGFTHEELHEMQKYDINQTLEAYEKRIRKMEEEIEYLTYVNHRMKGDYILIQKAAAEVHDVYEKDCVDQMYVLYKEGERLLQEPERLCKVQEFLYKSPEVQHIYIVPKEDLEKGRFTLCCGWAVKSIQMEKYHMTENEYTRHYPKRHSVMGISKIPVTLEELSGYPEEELKNMLIGKHLQYMQQHKMQMAGDIFGIVITRAVEDGREVLYLLMSIPVV
ncbi:MAG: MerR family transcriptional regulator [Lachnospira sp.]|nr:MerR family transcriptional regulator [Lachnospira sp.]